jgi:hypothetical protein
MTASYMESRIYKDARRHCLRKIFLSKPSKVTYNCG